MDHQALTQEIVKYIANSFGVKSQEYNMTLPIIHKQFLLTKKIPIEFEDGSRQENNIWAAKGKIENSIAKIWVADLLDEYILLFQLDDLTLYLLKFDPENSQIFVFQNKTWITLPMLLQAKLLWGIEQLAETLVIWEPLTENIDWFYEKMSNFIEFNESSH